RGLASGTSATRRGSSPSTDAAQGVSAHLHVRVAKNRSSLVSTMGFTSTTLHELDDPCCGNLGPIQVERFEPLQRHQVGKASDGDAKLVGQLHGPQLGELICPR